MSRFRRRIHFSFLLLYADVVTAIHEGPGHASRHEAPIDELMRRDGFRVSSRPLSKTSRAKDDAAAMPISEQAQKDFKAVEAVLAEGTPVRLPDLDSDSLQERLGRHGDVSTREESDALLQENAGAAPPYGPLGLGSLGSFSNFGSMGYGPGMSSGASSGSPFLSSFSGVLGSPKSPSPPGMPMPPLASSVASKESKDKKEIDFNNIDYIGCIIPQWTDGDWICAEAVDVPDMQIYDDAQHRTRKKLREGDACTVRCPDPRYWQKPQPSALVCKSGRWRDQVSRVNVKKIECETSGRWFLVLGFITVVVPLCGCCGAAAVLVRMKLKKKEKAPAEAPAAEAETKEETQAGATS